MKKVVISDMEEVEKVATDVANDGGSGKERGK